MSASFSYRAAFFKRLLKNKGAVFGLIIIGLAFLMAIFAYFLTPDNSPNANRIIPEIANQKPGFSIYFLRLNKKKNNTRFVDRLINGQQDRFEYIPLTGYKTTKDSIIIEKYIDEGITEKQSYALKEFTIDSTPIRNPDFIISQKFYLGTDKFGRDILSRLIIGVRVSLGVGLIAVIISLSVGILLGALAGYYKGRVDDIITWFINIIWSIPTLLLVFAITIVLGKGFWQVFIAVGLTMWVNVARLVRGQVLAIRELEYIDAARVMGFSDMRIITKHVLPNILGPVLVIAASNFASAIVIEAGLSFLGVGVQPPQPSWGLMIKENYNFIITNNPMLALAPGVAIMLLVLAFNLLGNGLRDALNIRSE